jgi:hypothetical protein
MSRCRVPLVVGIALTFVALASFSSSAGTSTHADLKKRLEYCGSIPIGASLTVVETTRAFISLPKDFFPHIQLSMKSNGATASYFSNAGAYGHAQVRNAKSGCWAYAFDFELSPNNKTQRGTVDIGSKSAYKGISNYLIHFKVVANPPSATKRIAGNGNVVGNVFLGPVCPVERIPPDPACAPKPYTAPITIWSTWTGSPYQPVQTDVNGVFKLSLPPGAYSMAASPATGGSPYPRCAVSKILVVTKKTQNVTVNCDTGIC